MIIMLQKINQYITNFNLSKYIKIIKTDDIAKEVTIEVEEEYKKKESCFILLMTMLSFMDHDCSKGNLTVKFREDVEGKIYTFYIDTLPEIKNFTQHNIFAT
ncbi:MAG: hypothetical protein RR144_04630 [Clostridia bacterium]